MESNGQKKFRVHLVTYRALVEDRWADEGHVTEQLRDGECLMSPEGVPYVIRCPFCSKLVELKNAKTSRGEDGRLLGDLLLNHGSCTIQVENGYVMVAR